MTMKSGTKPLLALLAALCATTLLALPTIDGGTVSIAQNQRSRLVTVRYTLTGDPAVVTVDFQTNDVATGTWTSIGGEKYSRLAGDVNMLVTNVNSSCSIFWQPTDADAWPNQLITGGRFRAVVKAWATNAPPPYMIVDLQDSPGRTWYYPSAEAIPLGITNDLYKTTRLAFRLVPASLVQWRMGSPSGEKGRQANLETQHLVTFTNDWYMGVYPTTQGQHALLGLGMSNAARYPSKATNNLPETATYPVDSIVWAYLRGTHYKTDPQNPGHNYLGRWPDDGHQVAWDSSMYNARTVTGLPSLDIPTEAMWEYVCRAGSTTATYEGDLTISHPYTDLDSVLDLIAWYSANSDGVTHPVGLKKANAWGFYDMLGNVNEWCLDQYESSSATMSGDSVIDPPGYSSDVKYPLRILRGGGFAHVASDCRSSARKRYRYGHDTSDDYTVLKSCGYRLCCDAMALK